MTKTPMERFRTELQGHAEAFRRVRSEEVRERRNWVTRWVYDGRYSEYKSPDDFKRWLDWFRPEDCCTHYLPKDLVSPLAEKSAQHGRRIFEPLLGRAYDYPHIDENNAVDYLLQNLYPVPERMKPRRILDFGAGYGRQLALWSTTPGLVYVAVDSIELSYTLQSFYLNQFSLPVHEYTAGARNAVTGIPGVYHVPGWRTDLLPDGFFDLAIFSQVLQEIPAALVRSTLQLLKRCVKPGGAIYIRDPGLASQEMHRIDVQAALLADGFALEFCPYVRLYNTWAAPGQPGDISAIPRIFRRIDESYAVYRRRRFPKWLSGQNLRSFIAAADLRSGGALHRMLGKRPR